MKPTIYQIKRELKNAPHFFDKLSMKFFGQCLSDFKVYKTEQKDIFKLTAYSRKKEFEGCHTSRLYNNITKEFIKE